MLSQRALESGGTKRRARSSRRLCVCARELLLTECGRHCVSERAHRLCVCERAAPLTLCGRAVVCARIEWAALWRPPDPLNGRCTCLWPWPSWSTISRDDAAVNMIGIHIEEGGLNKIFSMRRSRECLQLASLVKIASDSRFGKRMGCWSCTAATW